MKPWRQHLKSLVSVADRADKVLRKISQLVKDTEKFSRRVLVGALGFFAGSAAAMITCILTNIYYAAFFVPLGAIIGLLIALLLWWGGSEAQEELIRKAWDMRDQEIATLGAEMTAARKRGLATQAMEDKHQWLLTRSPTELRQYYGLEQSRTATALPALRITDAAPPPLAARAPSGAEPAPVQQTQTKSAGATS